VGKSIGSTVLNLSVKEAPPTLTVWRGWTATERAAGPHFSAPGNPKPLKSWNQWRLDVLPAEPYLLGTACETTGGHSVEGQTWKTPGERGAGGSAR
jgi:hypothetical protein